MFHVVVAPGVPGDDLGAELFGELDADGFRFPIGVVGADGDPETVGSSEQHEFHFAARIGTRDLDRARLREEIDGDPATLEMRAAEECDGADRREVPRMWRDAKSNAGDDECKCEPVHRVKLQRTPASARRVGS